MAVRMIMEDLVLNKNYVFIDFNNLRLQLKYEVSAEDIRHGLCSKLDDC